MALTRKFLSAMGLDPDQIDEIITAHANTVDGLKEERDLIKKEVETYKTDAEKLPAVQKELDELKNTDGRNPFELKYNSMKEEYDKLKEEHDKFKADITAKETKRAKEEAYTKLLKDVGISEKRIASILKVSDLSGVELDKDGKIKDSDKIKDSIKTEWEDFIESNHQRGATTPTPPAGKTEVPKGESRAAKIAAQYHNNLYGENNKEE